MLPVHPDVSIHTLVRSIEGNDDLKVAAATYFPTDLQHLAKKMLSYAFPIMASGGLFGLYLIGKSVYNLVNVEEKMIVKGKSVNGLIMALRQKAENAHAIEFHFNGALYTLTEHQGNLILRDANNNIVHAFQNLTLTMLYERIPNIGQIKESIQLCDSLSDKLSQGAQQTFKCFLNPILIGTPDCNPPYVLGDHDGSTARMVLAAMRAGYITMDEQGLGMLAQVMELEAEVLAAENLALAKQNKVQADDLFKAFQQNEAARLTDLLDHMTFHAGYTLLISIGDGRNDRLSTDKDLDDQIRERLFDVGAKFIAGNHELLKTQHTRGVSFGDFAKDETSRDEQSRLQKKIYCNACYHQPNNTLYVHNGLKIGSFHPENEEDTRNGGGYPSAGTYGDNMIITALGVFPYDRRSFDPEKLVKKMNAVPLPETVPATLDPAENRWTPSRNEHFVLQFTDFRPDDEENAKAAVTLNLNLVHGHDGEFGNHQPHVLNVNSRLNDQYLPAAAYVGTMGNAAATKEQLLLIKEPPDDEGFNPFPESPLANLRKKITTPVPAEQESNNVLSQQAAALLNKALETDAPDRISATIIDSINSLLSADAKEIFSAILHPPLFGALPDSGQLTLVAGDTDGSLARELVLAFLSGHARTTPEGVARIAWLLNTEAGTIRIVNADPSKKEGAYKKFQENTDIQKCLRALADTLTFHKSRIPFKELGDVTHDRFSAEKNVARRVREKLHEQGVEYIRGNHDVFMGWAGESNFGDLGYDTATPEIWKQHEDVVLTNAAYDEQTNTLYLHNGLEIKVNQETGESEIQTAFGSYPLNDNRSIKDFVNKLNEVKFDQSPVSKQTGDEQATFTASKNFRRKFFNFTNFRRDPVIINAAAKQLGVNIVYGHNGEAKPYEYSLCLNPVVRKKIHPMAGWVGIPIPESGYVRVDNPVSSDAELPTIILINQNE